MSIELVEGARVAILGGGPAGSFSSFFLLELSRRVGLSIEVDIYEPKDFMSLGAIGCNHCGGIISESLVQMLAAEGINLPPTVVQRSLDSYVLHTDVGSVRIETPSSEARIGAIHRGGGPRRHAEQRWDSFDGHLLALACEKGARVERTRVDAIERVDGRPRVRTRDGRQKVYDLVVAAVGVNSTSSRLFEDLGLAYRRPGTVKTFIREFYLGVEGVRQHLGSSMHVFLLDVPHLEFAALIPKGEFATLVVLGDDVDASLVDDLVHRAEVRSCLPPGFDVGLSSCQCAPKINVRAAREPFGDRVVVAGDGGVARLYKDGIGAAYRTGKACAMTAVFHGIGADDFRRHYWPECHRIDVDNRFGRGLFAASSLLRVSRRLRRVLVRAIARDQRRAIERRRLSGVLWDTFTGSAPYRDVARRAMHPGIALGMARAVLPMRGDPTVAS